MIIMKIFGVMNILDFKNSMDFFRYSESNKMCLLSSCNKEMQCQKKNNDDNNERKEKTLNSNVDDDSSFLQPKIDE